MSAPLPITTRWPLPHAGRTARVGIVAAVLALETLFLSYLIQRTPIDWVTGPARAVRDVQHWLFRFLIVFAVCLGMLTVLRGRGPRADGAWHVVRWRSGWTALHLALLLPFAILSNGLYSGALPLPFAVVAVAWHACALAAAFTLLLAAAPWPLWRQALQGTGVLQLYAFTASAAAVLAIQASQQLWLPAAEFTFRLVLGVLHPLLPSLRGDLATMALSTDRFSVTVSAKCSGLEGVGLMLVFCATWLGCFRREYAFPRALLIVPVAMALAFGMNVLRIAALVAIGDAGYPQIAIVGFHSQAGWIAFNLVALGVAIVSKRSAWMQGGVAGSQASTTDNPTAAYLMPLLAVLAAGMVSHALSAGFELLYPLRWLAAIAALWIYRSSYAAVDWHVSWRAPVMGAVIAVLWLVFAHYLIAPSPEPDALRALPAPLHAGWIISRALAATVTVPIVEELAYRGFLLRRLMRADFETLPFSDIRWPQILVCALAFGVTHGVMWFPAVLAGLAYGALTVRTGKLGEAVVAHAVTNALIAVAVLLFGQWQLW